MGRSKNLTDSGQVLTDSTIMGKPDIEALEISQRLGMINNIFDVTAKPLIMDADTGGKMNISN